MNTLNELFLSMDATILSGDETLMAYSRYTQLRNLLTGSVKHLRTGTITPVQTRFEVLMETVVVGNNKISENLAVVAAEQQKRGPIVREAAIHVRDKGSHR